MFPRSTFPFGRTAAALFFVLPALCLLAACAPKYYAPNVQNVPLLTREGEASTSVAMNAELNRFDLHVALAATKHWAFQGNGALWLPPHSNPNSTDGGSGALFEFGPGYTMPLPFVSIPNLVLETYLLAAYGAFENHFPDDDDGSPDQSGKIRGDLVRISLQPAIGYKLRYFEAAASVRYANLVYLWVEGDLESDDEDQERYIKDRRVQYLLEPALTLRGGLPFLMLEAQAGLSLNMGNGNFPQDNGWGSLGLVYRFNPP
jgi:hypothetical protein